MIEDIFLGCFLVKHTTKLEAVFGRRSSGVAGLRALGNVILISNIDPYDVAVSVNPYSPKGTRGGPHTSIDLYLRHSLNYLRVKAT